MVQASLAQDAQEAFKSRDAYRSSVNANTVTIIGGSITGTYIRLIDDISRSIGTQNDLRILPIRGSGGTNVRDILYLRGIDMGIVRSDLFDAFRGQKHYENLEQRLTYIAVLHQEEFHLLTSNPEIRTVQDLEGKVVAFPYKAHISGLSLFKKLGIKIRKVVHGTMFTAAAQEKAGEVDAILRVIGKPFGAVDRVLKLNPDLRFIPIPYDDRLIDSNYLPSSFKKEEYPEFVKDESGRVPTVAVNAVLGAYNWQPGTDRHRRLVKFTEAFFSRYGEILDRKGRHPKWSEINPRAKIAGWKRFPAAAAWLANNAKSARPAVTSNEEEMFKKFITFYRSTQNVAASGGSQNNEQRMFKEFLKWRQQNPQ
jgi:TRAP-type uncharacterized transport system substrate-binding protein